jgi:Di-haem oxidoreductase, putative peroxidase
MREFKKWIWIAGVPTLLASCALEGTDPKTSTTSKIAEPLVLTAGTRLAIEGILEYGSVVFAENPTTLLERADFHGYEFDGRAGGIVTITMNSKRCGAPDTLLALFGPENEAGDRGRSLVENDDAFLPNTCFLDSQIRQFRLPRSGTYLVVATSFLQEGGGHYRLSLACNNNACALPGAPTFASTRIAQADIDRGAFSPDDLFEMGDFLFEVAYRVEDGMGNGLPGLPGNGKPRPNFREIPNNVHFQAFGAPEAQSCVSCHNVGGDDGAGDNNHNIFQAGDGINRNTGLGRNGIALLGMGLRQAAGTEMTRELAALLQAGKDQARATNTDVTVTLRPPTNPINFGTAIAKPDGTVDFTGIRGIDPDLIVRPFGWKGREATIRRFIEGGFRVHFGMQTEPSVNNHCRTPNVNTFGNGPNCQDPDQDGVEKEISDGQLSAETVYLAMLEMPVRVPGVTPQAQTRINQGEALFNQVGCQGCHRQFVTVKTPRLALPGDTTGGAGITIDFTTDMRDPKPALNADGSMTIEVWSDFKRRDMGPELADFKNFNQIRAVDFITPPLWGTRDSAPYLHDGRAKTLFDSIVLHGGGDDVNSVAAFLALTADDQQKIIEFMSSLGRIEDVEAQPVDLGGFDLTQTSTFSDFFVPRGTLVKHDGYLVIARNATRSQFQSFYGKTLGSNVVFINASATGQPFPRINGGETYTLFDPQFVVVDGPTIAQPTNGLRTFGRRNCDTAASAAASWTSAGSSTSVATPGSGVLNSGLGKICISEIADVAGGGFSPFEFIEIFVE